MKSTIAYGSTGVANNLLPTSISNGNGAGTLTATHTAGWDAFGNLTSLDGPLSGTADTTGYRYDTARRLVMTVSPDPDGGGTLKHRAQRLTYNGDGNVTKAESGTTTTLTGTFSPVSSGERVEIAYDTLGRKTKESLVSGTGTINALTQFSYDTKGRLSCTAQRMNPAVFGSLPASACTLGTTGSFGPDRITKAVYNNRNEVTQNQVAVGTTVQANEQTLTWTDNGRLASLKDGENNLTTYIHDGHDRLSQTRFPSPTKGAGTSSTTDYEQLAYDANGNVTSRRLRDGQSIAFTFDALNRATLKNLPGTEPDVTYTYDNLGRMTGASQTGNVLSFTFDALGRNLTQAGPHGTVSSAWDLAGRRTRLTYPGSGLYVDQDYLVTGEVAKLRENGATSGAGVLATFAYDDLGRRTSLTRGNATVTSYSHDPISRLTSLTQDLASTTNDLTIGSMSYNPASQIISQSRSNDGYAWTGHYNLNSNYTANGLNQYIVTGSITPTYDPRGNLTSAGGATFSYSSENMLTSASGGVSLAYDPMLRLYQTVGSTTTRMAYDGLDLIAEYNGSNALLRRYVHGPGMDEPLVWYEGTGTTDRRWLHGDERGSIVAISNGSGAATTINRYDEYGTPGSSNAGRFQYTGQQWLPELGMYHYKARIYSPTLGRFLQTDSIGYEDGMNMYAYVGNDPVNFTDPLGLYSDIVVTACRWCFGSGGFGLSSSGSGISGGTAGEPPLPPRIQEALDEILVVGTRPPAPPRPAVSPAPIPAASATGPGRFMCEAAITPDGDTKGNNPRRGSSGYNTDLPGGLGTAYSVFIGLTRLAGDTNFQFGPLLRPDILLRSSRGIQLRIGDDGRPRIDIPANVLHLWRPETIHFTGGRGNICPTQ